MKNDTYESVCSPEDVAERNKLANRNAAHTQNGGGGGGHSLASTMMANVPMNNARILKRVVSAPVQSTETKGKQWN